MHARLVQLGVPIVATGGLLLVVVAAGDAWYRLVTWEPVSAVSDQIATSSIVPSK